MLRPALTVAAVVAVSWALVDAVRDAGEVPLPQASGFLAAVVLLAAGVLLAAVAWARLLDGASLTTLLPSFTEAQLAKYVPGAIWQGVGQVLGAERLGVRRARASVAFLVQLWTQLVAATCVGALLVLDARAGWMWLLPAAGILGLITLARRPLVWVLGVVGRLLRREAASAGRVAPAQRDIIGAALLGAGTIALGGWSFSALLLGPRPQVEVVAVVAAFAAAWVAGFLVVPLPAGAGVREFVLLAALGSEFGAAAVLAAAVVHRVVALVAEILLAVVARAAGRARTSGRSEHHPHVELEGGRDGEAER